LFLLDTGTNDNVQSMPSLPEMYLLFSDFIQVCLYALTGTFLSGAIDVWERSRGKTVPWKVYVWFIAVGASIGVFTTWLGSHRDIEQLSKDKITLEAEIQSLKYPKFKIKIEKVFTHMQPIMELKTLGTVVILIVSLENSGADSFAKWQPLNVRTSKGTILNGQLKATSDNTQSTINLGDNIELTWWGTDALYNKTLRNPIKRGARDIGVLEYVLIEQEGFIAQAGTEFNLSLIDVTGKQHSTVYAFETSQGIKLECYPGLKMKYENVRTKFPHFCN
jgi:hypothetical protein